MAGSLITLSFTTEVTCTDGVAVDAGLQIAQELGRLGVRTKFTGANIKDNTSGNTTTAASAGATLSATHGDRTARGATASRTGGLDADREPPTVTH